MIRASRSDRLRLVLGSLCGGAALLIIWICRSLLPGELYVSAMGALGMRTAPWFNFALILLAAAALLIASGSRSRPRTGRRRKHRLAWSAGTALVFSACMFAIASTVTCTPGCPVPLTAGSTVQDLIHVGAAALGFAGALAAVLEVSWSATWRIGRAASIAVLLVVALCASAGAIASLAGWTGGGWFEFAATTAAVVWLVAYGAALAFERARVSADAESLVERSDSGPRRRRAPAGVDR